MNNVSAVSRLLITLLLTAAFASSGIASGRSHSSTSSSSGTVYVRGYTKANGTYVAPYTRRAPGTATNALGSTSTDSVYHGSTLAEQSTAPNTSTQPPALPKGFVTADQRKQELARYERFQQARANRYEAHVVGFNRNGSAIIGTNVARDSHGRIKRSEAAKHAFMQMTGYPKGRPGYVVDHIIPLSKGGADDPGNMQWQTIEEAKAKDKWERK